MKYEIRELTPREMRSIPFGGCPAIYEVLKVKKKNLSGKGEKKRSC